MLRILSRLQEKGLIDFDPFIGKASLTEAGTAALLLQHRGTENG